MTTDDIRPDDRWIKKAGGGEFRVLAVEPDRVTLRSPGGGTDVLTRAELAAGFVPSPELWRAPDGRTVHRGSRWKKGGELFTVERIDHPPVDRVIVRGDKGQGVGVSPIAELLDLYAPASPADEARLRPPPPAPEPTDEE